MPFLIPLALGGVGGFFVANKTTELTRLLVIGGMVYYFIKVSK